MQQALVSKAWKENKTIHTTSPRALVPTTCYIYPLWVLFSLCNVPAISPWHVLLTVILLCLLEALSLLICMVGTWPNQGTWQASGELTHMSSNCCEWCHQQMCLQSSAQEKFNNACLSASKPGIDANLILNQTVMKDNMEADIPVKKHTFPCKWEVCEIGALKSG